MIFGSKRLNGADSKDFNAQGFSALGLIGAVSIGSILSLGYLNLSHYLIAQNALEQATRTAVRCVSPTNGDCSSLVQPSAQPRWRYAASILSPKGDVYGEEYDYSAKMFRETFRAETNYYSIPQEHPPQVAMTTYSLPMIKYQEVPAYKRVDLTFEVGGSERHLYAEPYPDPFPVVNEAFELQHENSSFEDKIADATPSQKNVLGRFSEVFGTSFSQPVTGTESERIGGDYVRYFDISGPSIGLSSLLKSEVATEGCLDGKECSVRQLAGSISANKVNDYKNFRYLSFYLEIELTNHSSEASIGIKGSGGKSGLIVDLSGPTHSNRVCLGGRDLTKLNTLKGNYFNLRLRGPAKANGGDIAWDDKECGGDYRLSDILIDKEGIFKPRISLAIAGPKGSRVTGRVKLYAFADTYKVAYRDVPFSKICAPFPLLRNSTVAESAPSLEKCGVPRNIINVKKTFYSKKENYVGCVTNTDDVTLIPASIKLPDALSETFDVSQVENSPREIEQVICNLGLSPVEPSSCGWKPVEGSLKQIEIGSLPQGECTLAKTNFESSFCNGSEIKNSCDVEGLNPSTCDSYKKKKAELLSVNEVKGIPIGSSDEIHVELIRGQSAVPKLSCEQEKSQLGQTDCGISMTKKFISYPLLKRADPSWRPTEITNFIDDGVGLSCQNISSQNVIPISPEPEEIELTGFPFSGDKTLEISEETPKLVGDKFQCSSDASEFLTLEQRLREYAALNGFTEARDPKIAFEYEAKSLGRAKLISSTTGCVSREFSPIQGCPKLQTVSAGSETCGDDLDLGVSEVEPELCRTPGVKCQKVFDGISEFQPAPPRTDESAKLAAQLALNILQKFLPQSKPNCAGRSCTEVKININPDKTVSAVTKYQMPLTWPLNELLGKESLEINRIRTERIEAL